MKSFRYLLLLALFASTPGCLRQAFTDLDDGSSAQSRRIQTDINSDIELRVGDTAIVKGTGIEITFSAVSADSRCPSDVICIWAGEARLALYVLSPEAGGHQAVVSIPGLAPTPYVENQALDIEGFKLRLLALNPYPTERFPSGTGSYKALFRIES